MAVSLQHFESDNQGEKAIWSALATLPDDYYLLQELAINHGAVSSEQDDAERRPDFVVIGPKIGVVILESKDWNLRYNSYAVYNQRKFRRMPGGKLVTNPWFQARTYRHDVEELLSYSIPVTAATVFPLIGRAKFVNAVGDPEKLVTDPQTRMLANPALTIFEDDMASGFESLLVDRVTRAHGNVRIGTDLLNRTIETLLPSEFRIGNGIRRAADLEQLRVLSERQQEIAFKIPAGKHFLLDIAGSGKTNILISRAIHFARRAVKKRRDLRILLTSHSETLCEALDLTLRNKIRGNDSVLLQYIDVRDIRSIVREIVSDGMRLSREDFEALFSGQNEEELAQAFTDVVKGVGERYRRYDVVLIDEIQDCDRWTRPIVTLVWKGEDLFMAGDVGQHLRGFDLPLHRFGIDMERSRVESDFISYRCPSPIAAIAHRFAWASPVLRKEFREHAYPSDIQDLSRGVLSQPETRCAVDEGTALKEVVSAVSEEVAACVPLNQIMVVSNRPEEVKKALEANGTSAVRRPTEHLAVVCVTFDESKGLEAEVVIVTDVERLGPGADVSTNDEEAALWRCRAYVAITRAQRRMIWIYYNTRHHLVADLLKECRAALAVFAQ